MPDDTPPTNTSGPRNASARRQRPPFDRSDPRYWKLGGIIYYNPDDPEYAVERRGGTGVTLNFARREAWFTLAAILAVALFIIAVVVIFAFVRTGS